MTEREHFWLVAGGLVLLVAIGSIMLFVAAYPALARSIVAEYRYFILIVMGVGVAISRMLGHPHWPVFALILVGLTWAVSRPDLFVAG